MEGLEEQDPLEKYLLLTHKANILQILLNTDTKKHYSININFVELFENNTSLGNTILKRPEEALEELDDWILHIQDILLKEYKNQEEYVAKCNMHARVYGLPPCPELHRTMFPKNEDMDLFLQITGTVIRVTATKMLEYQKNFMCTKCKHIVNVEAIFDQKYIIVPPKKCTNQEKCSGTNLVAIGDLNSENCKDYQEIKIQEQSSKVGVGVMPSSMWVILEDDLVDVCKPGDDVTICGTVKRRWDAFVPGKKMGVELVTKANHVQVNNSQTFSNLVTPEIQDQFNSFWEKYRDCPLKGRDLILKSFCPKIFGMHLVKLAVTMVLAGGSRCTEGNQVGIQIRSEPHILLVGDPGTGKSQILRYAAKVIPRSVLTTGVGTTSAGLTVAAVMEDGQWQLEGGALVLADGGICCIDEFNSMKAHDRASIHEAMEQQTISVAKASIVCKLSTRCSILAATNPKGGHLDSSQCLSLNLALPSPLLSRFDVILMLKDSYDKDWDNLIADYILKGKSEQETKLDTSLWNLETLQQYFTVIKKLNPTLSKATNTILSAYYQAQRRATFRNKARTTVRLLDSLIRLSQAHARVMFHSEVQVMDAIFAIVLMESSMHGECSVLPLNSLNVQAPPSNTPMQNYADLVKTVLTHLGLPELLTIESISLNNKYDCTFNEETTFINADTTDGSVLQKSTENEVSISEISILNRNCNTNIPRIEETQINDVSHRNNTCTNFEKPTEMEKNEVEVQKEKNTRKVGVHSKIETITKKRRNTELLNPSKETKIAKIDNNIFNLIPSVNDDFNLDILNYTDSQEEVTSCSETINFCNNESTKTIIRNDSQNENLNNFAKPFNENINSNSSAVVANALPSISFKNKLKQFAKSFTKANLIEEIVAPNLSKAVTVDKNVNKVSENSVNSINEIEVVKGGSQKNLTQSLFENEDEDTEDNFNLDF